METIKRTTPASDAEREAIESLLGLGDDRLGRDAIAGQVVRGRRHLLLPCLHALNDRIGWISPPAIDHLATRLGASPAEIHAVASFYGLFSLSPRNPVQRHVCIDLACRAAGGPSEETVTDGAHPAPCLGLCDRAPAAITIGAPNEEPDPASAAVDRTGDDVLLRRVGADDPLDLDAYLANGGFSALKRARDLGPEGIIAAVEASGLTGRGGAGFPTARKWDAVRTQPVTPHHLICNADESEPGTFKDRTLIENDPYALIESMAIAGLAIGCELGRVYLRGEYLRAYQTLSTAIERCRSAGHLGPSAGFDIEIIRGAGAYICGEETAIFNSIEGYRGEPRNKPPFPFESGLFGQPTAVNNVETLMNVPSIVAEGRRADRRLFCLSGAVRRPGVIEAPIGITLGELIERAGGLRDGSELRAVMLGGAAGGFAGPGDLDLSLDDTSLREVGLTLGSGVVMVHDQHVDLVDQLRRIAAFFRDESCGQCVPCRVGTIRQEEAIERLASGTGEADLALLRDIAGAMRDASICGLGQTAANAIQSAVVRLGVLT
jgi:NADH-quinone oxidoreductase subunit F